MIHRRHHRSPEWAEIRLHAEDFGEISPFPGQSIEIKASISSGVSFVVCPNIMPGWYLDCRHPRLSKVRRMPMPQNLHIDIIPMKGVLWVADILGNLANDTLDVGIRDC
jgi:hypothetical protein